MTTPTGPKPGIARDLDGAEIANARLPQNVWLSILKDHLQYKNIKSLPLKRDLDPSDRLIEDEITNIKWTCRALHRWVQEIQWQNVCVISSDDLKNLLLRARSEPGALNFVTTFRVSLRWAWSSKKYRHEWHLMGDPQDWYFARRTWHTVDYLEECIIPGKFWSDDKIEDYVSHHGWTDQHTHYTTGWDQVEPFGSVTDVQKRLEQLLLQMHSLQTFHYGTQIVPMTEKMCKFLGQAKDLQVVSVSPSGEFFTNSDHLSPLWLIFEGRQDRPLECLCLNIEIFPSKSEFKTAKFLHEEVVLPGYLKALRKGYQEDGAPFALYKPSRYLSYANDETALEELNFVERPIAMVYRTLIASRGKLRQLQTTEKALLRVINLLPVWGQVSVLTYDNAMRRTGWENDPYAKAIQPLQEELRTLARGRDAAAEDCPPEDEFMKTFDKAPLAPLKAMLQGQRLLQEILWKFFLEGERKGSPDWERPRLQDGSAQDVWLSMGEEQNYVRGLPERHPGRDEAWTKLQMELKLKPFPRDEDFSDDDDDYSDFRGSRHRDPPYI